MKKNVVLLLAGMVWFFTLPRHTYADSWAGTGMGFNNTVHAVTTYRGKMIAAGSFTNTGSLPVNRIAAWNGTQWTPLGSGMNNTVYALCVYNDELYAAGEFTTAGGGAASRIAKWDGASWSPAGTGVNGPVYALAVYNNKIVAAGQFLLAGLLPVNNIASWNGSLWSALGSGLTTRVNTLAVYNGNLAAGGEFLGNILFFNGSVWSLPGLGLTNTVEALAVYDNDLYAGGKFTGNLVRYNGSTWSVVGGGLDKKVNALTVFRGNLIAGGDFTKADPSGANITVNRIAGWDGASWKVFSTGMNDTVHALSVADNYRLIAGGSFTSAGGLPIARLAVWDKLHVISGRIVRASDMPGEINGKVKALRIDSITRRIIVADSANIQSDGTFNLNFVPVTPHLVIGFPDDELDGFVPTYYPSGVSWRDAVPVVADTNTSDINISVIGLNYSNQPGSIGGVAALNYNPPFIDTTDYKSGTIIYAKMNGTYRGFSVSTASQRYMVHSLPEGTYEMFADRPGYNPAMRTAQLTGQHLDSVNFILEPDDIVGIQEVNTGIKDFSLHQNYPNPFNPVTSISFDLVKSSEVKLTVYNIQGRKTAELVHRAYSPGSYRVEWNAHNNSSGVYFYMLEVSPKDGGKPHSLVKKMLLVK